LPYFFGNVFGNGFLHSAHNENLYLKIYFT